MTKPVTGHRDDCNCGPCREVDRLSAEGTSVKAKLEDIHHTLDELCGDTDPLSIDDDWTEDEIRAEWPLFWVTKEIAILLQDTASGSPTPLDKRTQKRVLDWAVESFGSIAKNRDERGARLAEEAIEVAQTEGVTEDMIAAITRRVYERPPGELWQEIGGVGITLEALAENAGHSLEDDTEREWQRVLSKSKDWWTKKHAAKVAAGTANISPACDDSSQECEPPPESITGPPDAMFCRLCSKYVTHDDFPADPVDSEQKHWACPACTRVNPPTRKLCVNGCGRD